MKVFLEERPEAAQLRRSCSVLEICGKGTLILILWSLARFLMTVSMEDTAVAYMRDQIDSSGAINDFEYWIIFLILAAMIIAVYAFVSVQAIAESKGKKRGYIYLIVCVILLISSVWSVLDVFTDFGVYSSILDDITSFLFNIISIIIELCVIIYSLKIKKLKKILGEEAR